MSGFHFIFAGQVIIVALNDALENKTILVSSIQ